MTRAKKADVAMEHINALLGMYQPFRPLPDPKPMLGVSPEVWALIPRLDAVATQLGVWLCIDSGLRGYEMRLERRT